MTQRDKIRKYRRCEAQDKEEMKGDGLQRSQERRCKRKALPVMMGGLVIRARCDNP